MVTKEYPLLVHATHEAGLKLGGIGAVLDGLLGSPAYAQSVGRSVLIGPMNIHNHVEMERLTSPANHLTVMYSTLHGVNHLPPTLSSSLHSIETRMNVHFLYGRRAFGDVEHEVLLVDAQGIAGDVINGFKYELWNRWGLSSDRFQSEWEYSYYLDAGVPLMAALDVITADLPIEAPRYLIAHEWLGLPCVFGALIYAPGRYKTVFYAHEVATARMLVENDGGHDTRFYNALRLGLSQGQKLDEVFGDQSGYFKHAMIQRAGLCDGIFAVGDKVVDELRFLGGVFRHANIRLVYNGLPVAPISLANRLESRELLLQYAENLLGYRPDYVFTHVGRMVTSKAYWRDFRVLEHLEGSLAAEGKRAVLFTVSTADPSGRLPENVREWESAYGWPMQHRGDNGDLRGDELSFFFRVLEPFNQRSKAIRGLLVNQFGWSQERCGQRMPARMTFADLRAGTDLEFGQSIYEPFGIAQVEPLNAGALCVMSSVCGCVGFLRRAAEGRPSPNVIIADYVQLPSDWLVWSAFDALWIDRALRDGIEATSSRSAARQIMQYLPKSPDHIRQLLEQGQMIAAKMSWDVVVHSYLLPGLARLGDRVPASTPV